MTYPLERRSEPKHALMLLIRDFWIPEQLIFDRVPKQVKGNTNAMMIIRIYNMDRHVTKPHQPQQKIAEAAIFNRKRLPEKLWDYAMIWALLVMAQT